VWIRYVLQRVGFLLLVVWVASGINFFLPRLSTQDPIRQRLIEQLKNGAGMQNNIMEMVKIYDTKFGLDRPLWQQYLTYLGDLAHGDLGYSIAYYPKRVSDMIGDAMPWTIGLMGVSTLLAFVLGSIYGALVGWERAPRWTHALAPALFTLSAIPYYLMGLILLYIFSYGFKLLPGSGSYSIFVIPNWSWRFALDVAQHAILPAGSIILSGLGFWAMGMRGMMVTVEGEDYMTLGDAKGLNPRRLFLQYGVRNALLPQITSLALALGYVMSGSVLVEIVFGYPGLGNLLFHSVKMVDYPVIQGIVMTIIFGLALATLVLDLTVPLLDPRIRRA
jgi:peptide/nickel transport system permease protein